MSDPDHVARLTEALSLADELGSVTEACRRLGLTRSQFYTYRRRWRVDGAAGLERRSRAHHSHPHATTPELQRRVVEMSAAHPDWGSERLIAHLRAQGARISSRTVQRILARSGRGVQAQRVALFVGALTRGNAPAVDTPLEQVMKGLSVEARRRLARISPQLAFPRSFPVPPEGAIAQGVFRVGVHPSLGPLYLHLALDIASGRAFCLVSESKRSSAASRLLRDQVIPAIRATGGVRSVLTNQSRTYYGHGAHPYTAALAEERIERHVVDPGAFGLPAGENSLIERWRAPARRFFDERLRLEPIPSLDDLQRAFDSWLRDAAQVADGG
jgi:transposase